jgi:beta-lactam-binding protein with PASTA domain
MNAGFLRKTADSIWRFVSRRSVKAVSITGLLLVGVFSLLDYVVMPLYTRQGTARPVPDLLSISAERAASVADSAGFVLVLSPGKMSNRVPEGWIVEQHPFAGTLAKPGRKIRVVPAIAGTPDMAPDLIGLDVRDAQLRCRNVGLVSGATEVRYRFSGRVPKDGVLEQDPKPGRPVKQGEAVKLIVSLGPEPARFYVPALVDRSLHDARSTLREAGLVIGDIERQETDEYPAGTVVQQSPSPGQEVNPGTRIDVVVAVHPRRELPGLTESPDEQLDLNDLSDSIRVEQLRQDSIQAAERHRRDSIRQNRRRY